MEWDDSFNTPQLVDTRTPVVRDVIHSTHCMFVCLVITGCSVSNVTQTKTRNILRTTAAPLWQQQCKHYLQDDIHFTKQDC